MITQDTPHLEPLADRYEIIGELGGGSGERSYLARRRDTGADVLVRVLSAPQNDEGNALSHLAADVNRLAEHAHRNLVPVLEAQWLGNDTLAVVTERVPYPTLEDLLVRRNEAFSCPRVATILREINAALEWAREGHIVHRAVEPSSVYVEPGSDRVLLSFVARPLPRAGMPGPGDDARTIATLARAMLTRSVADPERDRLPLRELRPGLPDRLIDQTEEILALTARDEAPDVSEYIAVVAMSDFLKRAETECATTTAKLLEEERVARETIAAEREATARAAAEQARLFQLERDEFAQERERMLAEIAGQREALDRERELFAREREEHQRDRELFAREREEHRRWADEVEKAFEAQSRKFEEQGRALRDAEEAAAGAFARVGELSAQLADMRAELAARPASTAGDPRAGSGDDLNEDPDAITAPAQASVPPSLPPTASTPVRGIAMPPRPGRHRVRPDWQRSLSHRVAVAWRRRPRWNRKWNVPAAAAALLLVLIVSAVAIARTRDGAGATFATPAVAQTPGGTVVDSAAGLAGPAQAPTRTSGVGIPEDFARSVSRARESGVPRDFVAGVRERGAATTQDEDAGRSMEATPVPPLSRQFVRPDPAAALPGDTRASPPPSQATPASSGAAVTRPPTDTLVIGPPLQLPVPPVRRDTVRRDTVRPRPDTLRPPTDTLGLTR